MNEEYRRLLTFLDHYEYDDARKLAKAGFFYLMGNAVQCAFCRGIISDYYSPLPPSVLNTPMAKHAWYFPMCRFLWEEDVGNIPINGDPFIQDHDVIDDGATYN